MVGNEKIPFVWIKEGAKKSLERILNEMGLRGSIIERRVSSMIPASPFYKREGANDVEVCKVYILSFNKEISDCDNQVHNFKCQIQFNETPYRSVLIEHLKENKIMFAEIDEKGNYSVIK